MINNADINFEISKEKCTKCGLCASDCPINIIELKEFPKIVDDGMKCIKCGHCFSICPTGAISLLGDTPKDVENIEFEIDYEQFKKMIFSRRAVRKYKDEDVDKSIIQDLCKASLHAPTAKNDQNTLLTVIDNMDKMNEFKSLVYQKLENIKIADPSQDFFKMVFQSWNDFGIDKLFVGAPHMIIASAPKGSYNLISDPVIILSYFELLAVAKGLGTLWNGIMLRVLEQFPELNDYLKIPKGNQIGYVMMFGLPALKYKRAARRDEENIKYV